MSPLRQTLSLAACRYAPNIFSDTYVQTDTIVCKLDIYFLRTIEYLKDMLPYILDWLHCWIASDKLNYDELRETVNYYHNASLLLYDLRRTA